MISSELHLSVFGTEMISSDKRSIDISDTLWLRYFVNKMLEHRYDIRISESYVDPNPWKVERQDLDNFTFLLDAKKARMGNSRLFCWRYKD